MHTNDDLLFRFKEHLAVLNRSEATIKAYGSHARDFLNAVQVSSVKSITEGDIERYIADLYEHRTQNDTPYSVSTIGVKVRSIKRFFEYLERSNVIFIDPAHRIVEPKAGRRIKPTLSRKEIAAILDQPNLGARKGIRDRAILELLYATGIRRAELCAVTVYDVDLTGGLVRINEGKGGKDRVVPLGKHACRYLKEYIAKIRPHFTKKNRSNRQLFVDSFGKPLSNQMVGIIVKTYAKAAKIGKPVTAHTFRHTFATELVKNGASLEAVQAMLGHSRLDTTERYIGSLGFDLKKVHRESHPRERDTHENITPVTIERRIQRGRVDCPVRSLV